MSTSDVLSQATSRRTDRDRGDHSSRDVALAALVSSVGVAIVAAAYAAGRADIRGATAVLWVGQVVVFGPFVLFAVRVRDISAGQAAAIAASLAITPYVVKLCYSPTRLSFVDELTHPYGTILALRSHQLGGANTSLPIAADFPGLESVAACFADLTGLPVDVTAMIIAGVLKLALMLTILLLVAELTHSYRIAVLGVLLYAANGNFEFFNSFFIYQNAALPFAFLAVYISLVLERTQRRHGLLLAGGIVAIALTIVSHHATALFMDGMLLLAAIWAAVRWRPGQIYTSVMAVLAAVFTAIWFRFFTHNLGSYLDPYFHVSSAAPAHDVPLPDVSVPAEPTPFADLLFNRIGLVLVVLITVGGLALVLFRRIGSDWSRPWRFSLALVALSLLASAGIAETFSFGAQSGTRALVLTYLGAAVFGGAFLRWLLARNGRRVVRAGAAVILILCIVGGLEFGWPPWWEKIPGSYSPAGFESGFDPHVITAADWVRHNLPHQSVIVGDTNAATALSTLGEATVSLSGAPLFYDRTITSGDVKIIQRHAIRYLWIDRRIAEVRAPGGRYFSGALGVQYTYPPPLAGLTKWASVPNISTVYSDGTITIYDLAGTDL